MYWENSFMLLYLLIFFLSSLSNGHFVLKNGNHVNELTPAAPHEVDAFIHTLRRYAEETVGSRIIREGNIVPASPMSSNSSVFGNSTGHSNDTDSVRFNIAKIFDQSHNGNETNTRVWPQSLETSLDSIVDDTLQTLLNSLGHNASRPELFKTNFASKYSEETDD
ncbi:hypothetical protein GE061_012263 [Apolygus lucorum]|uniref:Uncharacterized protein n=1 Tax=Apolygus lucorum TaxID=248454 RepID=A0A6A4JWX3_APOLU|nr:hypothetical protein GE061_012263 [Apolygus lucorum]